jgi:hypothetical protein
MTSGQKAGLAIGAAVVGLALLVGGFATGIWMIVKNKPAVDALWVMALPFFGVVLVLAVASGVYSVIEREPQGNILATDRLRLRIVAVLGVALFVGLIGVLLIAAFSTRDVPGALLTLVSTIVGGLIGVLVPSVASSTVQAQSARPTVTDVVPPHGPSAGGTPVVLTGTGFDSPINVMFGDAEAANVVVVSPTQVTADAPAHPVGQVDVIVTTARGSSEVNAAARFTYQP